MILPQKRLLALFGFASAGALFAIFAPVMMLPTLLLDCALFFAVLYDFFSILRKNELHVERMHEKYLSLGAENRIQLLLQNVSRKNASAELRDGYPDIFSSPDDTMACAIPPLSEQTAEYRIVPSKKGEFSFEFVDVRLQGLFRLIARQYRYRTESTAMVFPNIIELKKYLRMTAVHRIEQLGYRKREFGGESEFDFLREYIPGDDYKRIHWKATAKRRFPVTIIYDREYNRNVVALLDCGRMMSTRYGLLTKFDYAVNAVLVLAAAARNRKDLFGIAVFSNTVKEFVAPRRGTSFFTGILPPLARAEAEYCHTDYQQMYSFLQKRLRKNSILFVFSELYNRTISAQLAAMLSNLTKHHAVRLVSFEEKEEEVEGKNAEEIARLILQKELAVEKELMIRDLERKGVQTLQVNRDDITRKVVNAYLSS